MLFILKELKFHLKCWDFYLKVLFMYKLVISKANTLKNISKVNEVIQPVVNFKSKYLHKAERF